MLMPLFEAAFGCITTLASNVGSHGQAALIAGAKQLSAAVLCSEDIVVTVSLFEAMIAAFTALGDAIIVKVLVNHASQLGYVFMNATVVPVMLLFVVY